MLKARRWRRASRCSHTIGGSLGIGGRAVHSNWKALFQFGKAPRYWMAEKAETCFGFLGNGEENSARRDFKYLEFCAQFAVFCSNMRHREKAQDLMAEGVGFEPTKPFRV